LQVKLIQKCSEELQDLADRKAPEPLMIDEVVTWAKAHRNSGIYQYLQRHGAFDPKKAMAVLQKLVVRKLMRTATIVLTELPNDEQHGPKRVRRMYSLWTDRERDGGYRSTTAILDAPTLRQQLIATVYKELRSIRERNSGLTELISVWSAIDGAQGQTG
jgi:hypothetical protein